VKPFRTGNIRLSTLRKRRRRLLSAAAIVLVLIAGMLVFLARENPVPLETHHPPWRYGTADARFTLVFYADLECPYCKDYSSPLRRWIDANPDVNLHWHHLPLPIHEPAASEQARWVECAGQIGGNTAFWRAVQWVYANTRSDGRGVPDFGAFPDISVALKACAASEQVATIVQTQADEALASGITATPSLRLTGASAGRCAAVGHRHDGRAKSINRLGGNSDCLWREDALDWTMAFIANDTS